MPAPSATLQISLAPSDYAHAQHLLKHQVDTWRESFSELLVTIDYHKSKGRFSARWEEGRQKIGPLAQSLPGVRVVDVDYSAEAEAKISTEFFNGKPVPRKDFRGGPYYSYFFGLAAASHDLIFHVDSDIFFGGGSKSWFPEAKQLFESDPDVLVCAPLPGPPRPDGRILTLQSASYKGRPGMHVFPQMSTRLFLMSRSRFQKRIGGLTPTPPPALRARIKAIVERNPPQDLPEHLFSAEMVRHGMSRVDFLGSGPGMWSLHPPYRSADFYQRLPELIRRVETGDVPDLQRGDHDFNSSMVDWSEPIQALRNNRWWKRLLKR